MGDGKIRAELLQATRSLNAKGPEQLSIAALCKKTGMSRSKVRCYFPTNAALKASVTKKATVKKQAVAAKILHYKAKPEDPKLEEPKLEEFKLEEPKLEEPKSEEPEVRPETPIIREDWLERRFR